MLYGGFLILNHNIILKNKAMPYTTTPQYIKDKISHAVSVIDSYREELTETNVGALEDILKSLR